MVYIMHLNVLNSKSTTELGDRSGNANFIQAVIVITDARCRGNRSQDRRLRNNTL